MKITREPSAMHRLTAVLLLLLIVVAVDWVVEEVVLARHEYYQEHIERIQDRLERANSLLAQRPELEKQIKRVKQNESSNAYYLNQASPTIAATDLQQRVKTAIESNGGQLMSTQILPETSEGAFTKVAIRVQMTGDTEALQKTLYALEAQTPLLFVDNIQIRARPVRQPRRSRTEQPSVQISLTTQFELAGYLRGSGG